VCASTGKCYADAVGIDVSTASQSNPEQPSFAYAVGDVIAEKYALEELLGEGGMGAVFRARNTAIDMPVALKLIRADLNRELLSGRLLQEARAAAKLTHPAIVRVFDVGQTALGDPFIVMELLEGESLSAIIDREQRLTATRAVQMLLPIADALSAAHAKGFVHRDVKPDNVFVVHDAGELQPKLVDFGIVKLPEREGNSQLTQIGSVLGSPEYMSPEQARGLEHIDLRSDVWSFSIMLYETIAGETPFESTNYNALLRMIVETEAVTLKERGVADDTLSGIVACGMSKDPAQRFGSLGAMGKALAVWIADQGINEDVCGISLETKWLTRQTDPHGAGRPSRSSIPDGWFEQSSGVRNIGRSFATAPTLQATRPAGTPVSLAPVESTAQSPSRKRVTGTMVVVALGALALGWFVLGRSSTAPNQAAAAAPLTSFAEVRHEADARRAPPTRQGSQIQSSAAPPASAAATATGAAPSSLPQRKIPVPGGLAAAAAEGRPAPPASPAPAAKPAATGASSDLIAPY
jgi:eukaryotic-like serine/threonine-protein kinase